MVVLNDQAMNDLTKPNFMYSKFFMLKLQTMQIDFQNIFASTTKYNLILFCVIINCGISHLTSMRQHLDEDICHQTILGNSLSLSAW